MSRVKQEPFNHLPPSQYSVWQKEYRTCERRHKHLHTVWHPHTQDCYSKENALLNKLNPSSELEYRQLTSEKRNLFSSKHGILSLEDKTSVSVSCHSVNVHFMRAVALHSRRLQTRPHCKMTPHYESHSWPLRKTTTASLPTPHASFVLYFTTVIKHASYQTKSK